MRKNIFAEVSRRFWRRGGDVVQVWAGQHGWDKYMHPSCSRGKRERERDRQCLWKKLDCCCGLPERGESENIPL